MSIVAIVAMIFAGKNKFFAIAKHWAHHVIYAGRVKLEIKGLEKLDINESYIFCANHSSMVDIPIMIVALRHNCRIIFKHELVKVPIFGWCLSLSPYISIKRENPRDSMAGIDKAIESIRAGGSLLVFPEGTRTLDGKLGKFKRGAFLLASRSGKKIVPVTIVGSQVIMPNKALLVNKGKVSVIISDPIEYFGTTKIDEMKLIDTVFNEINDNLAIYTNPM